MNASTRVLAVLALAACAGIHPVPALAGHDGWTVHVEGRRIAGEHRLDLALPWSPDDGGNLFDFAGDAQGDLGLERLRTVMSALRALPEGRAVTIQTDSDDLRAHLEAGFLVLEPEPRNDRERCRIEIPEDLVRAMLARNGRLTDADIEHLVRADGRVTLVRIHGEKADLKVWIDGGSSED